jgi:hypothetical protein
MGFLSMLIPSLIGGAASLIGGHKQDKAAQAAANEKNLQAQHDYNMRMWRYKQAMQNYDLKRGMMKDFIDAHGLKPGKSVVDYLNAPDPTAPSFNDIGGVSAPPSTPGLTNFLGGVAEKAGQIWPSPNRTPPGVKLQPKDTGDIGTTTGVGPEAPPVNVEDIEKKDIG